MKIKLVFAVDATGGFGKEQSMPWPHNSQDMKNFQKETAKRALYMGAKTFMSLPKNLKNRPTVVELDDTRSTKIFNKSGEAPEMTMYQSTRLNLMVLEKYFDEVVVIGGPEILLETIRQAHRYDIEIVMTEYYDEYEADTFFNFDEFQELTKNFVFDGLTEYEVFSVGRYINYEEE